MTNPSPRANPTIGFLTPRIGDNVSQALWSGVVAAAQAQGANVICFAGEVLCDASGMPSPANIVYDLVNTDKIDGLVTWASSLGGSLEHDGLERFHRQYAPLPMVSITLPLTGIPTVAINSYQGMCDLITHLVKVHGYRRLAFIHGPEGHYYAQERYRAYADTLQSLAIPLDPKLITNPGDFSPAAGAEGIRVLLDERKLQPQVDFEAVVTVSDLTALGALRELQARKIQIPETLALAGFNDIMEGRFVTPPLTSVRLPFYEQGQKAVEMLMALIVDRPVPQHIVLPAKLQVRQSCGCLLPSIVQAATDPTVIEAADDTTPTVRRQIIVEAITQAAESSANQLEPGWAVRLLDSFDSELVGDPAAAGAFLRELDHMLRQVRLASVPVQTWQNVVSALRRYALPYLEVHIQTLHRAENLWGQARVLVGEAVQRARGHEMVHRARQIRALHATNQALVTTFDLTELADILARGLPQLAIESCYLSLYENPKKPTAGARLILAYDGRGRIESIMDEVCFPTADLAPIGLADRDAPDKPYSLVLEPLYFQEEQIGFVLFGIGPREGTIYEVLRGQISSSLKGAFLFDGIRTAQVTAEKADRLKTLLLANVSHELRSPLNVILGYTREALDAPLAYGATLPEELLNDLVHIHHSAEHQLRVINDLLDLSRAEIDELDLYLEPLDPRPLLEEIFDGMASASSKSNVTWHIQLPDRLPTIWADPVRFRQILFNLLSNADKFIERGRVLLGAEVTPRYLHIWVQDTGPGIPADMQQCVFEPFMTAGHTDRRQEGAGLGLSITRRLVALHRGSIELESQLGQGSMFHVYLPLPTLSDRPPASTVATQPVLLLISAHDRPAAEIVEFSQRLGLTIQKLKASDDLELTMQRVQPAALAWDLADARASDWLVVRRLRNHPRLSQAPFILYGQKGDKEPSLSIGLTDFVAKPTDGQTLMAAIESVCPPADSGPILIVDDDPQVLEFYQQIVTREYPGYSTRTAPDGLAALSLMAEDTPSLVILDLMMPQMDGFDVLDWMRANDRTRRTPVLILSGRVLTLDDVKRLEQHALVTLQSKGILSTDELLTSLHRALFDRDGLPPHTSTFVKRTVAYLQQNYARPLSRWEIAEAIGVSEDYLSRVFRQELGLSPWDYLNRFRILQAIEQLRHTNDSVGAIARRVGFKDPAYFSRVFRKMTGQSPTAFRAEPPKDGFVQA